MGRELKRVPLNFDWPLKKIWSGYLNPYYPKQCDQCNGTGYNPETKRLSENWYNFSNHNGEEGWGHHLVQEEVDALVEKGRLMNFTHEPINQWQLWVVNQKIASGKNSWLPFHNGYHPTAEEVNEWSQHDAINQWICVEARAKRLGIWGHCEKCDGEGEIFRDDEHRKLCEEWKDFEPPKGPGFQLWETTSEGSPVSPVFKTLDELCRWAAVNVTTFGSHKTTAQHWKKMLDEGFVRHEEGHNVFI